MNIKYGRNSFMKILRKSEKKQMLKIAGVVLFLILVISMSYIIGTASFSYKSKASSPSALNNVVSNYIPGVSVLSLALLHNESFAKASPSIGKGSVAFAKLLEDGNYVVVGGFLYANNKIVTVKHVTIDQSWIYTYGPNFGENFSKNIQFSDIDHVVAHDSLDLSVIVLKNDSAYQPLPIASAVEVGETATIGSSRELVWKTFEKTISELGRWDPKCVNSDNANCICSNPSIPLCKKEINTLYPQNSIFAAPFGILAPGDCGAPAVQKGDVIGYAFGEVKMGFFDSGKTTFINVTQPEVRAWIDKVK